jgi:Glycosyl transferase family 41
MHLARYPLADLFLDTAPYGAHTTASDALWLGVPVLTVAGRAFPTRVCSSLVRAAGLEDLVCATPDEYVERAVVLGRDRAAVQAYKDRLEAGRATCTLFDTDLLVRRLEELYRRMYREFLEDRLPRPDLANLPVYHEIGLEFDHEATEVMTIPDYRAWWKERLTRRHHVWPIPPDQRLWTAEDIARAEAAVAATLPAGLEPVAG